MGREEHCKKISLVSVGSAPCVSATLGLPPLTACVLSQATLLRSGLLCRNCLRQALGCMHFHGLSSSSSGFQVLHKGADSVGSSILCPSPFRAVQVTGAWRVQSPPVGAATYRLPHSCHSVFWVYNRQIFLGVLCVSSGELISGCNPPDRCRPTGIQRSLGYQ